MTKNKYRVLVVDDEPVVCKSIQFLLEQAGFNTSAANTGREAVRRVFEDRPHLVILDVGMPGLDGFATLERLRDQSEVPVIMLTGHSELAERVKGLDMGAVDYVLKPFATEELLARIRRRLYDVQAGQKRAGLRIQTKSLAIDFGAHRLVVDHETVNLTPIEWKLLNCLVERRGEVVAYNQLGQAGWGDADYGDERAIKVRISTLRAKLRDDARHPRYIYTEREIGYRFEPME